LARVTVVWRRELGVLAVNWTDILDGEIVNAAWAVAGMLAKPRAGHKVAASLDTAAWADTERLVRDALAGIAADPDLPELSEDEAAELEMAVRMPEVQGALQALLAVRLTDAPEADAARAREAVRLALATRPDQPPGDATRDRRRPALASLGDLRNASLVSPSVRRRVDDPGSAGYRWATLLSEYFDDKIFTLVATLEGRVGFAGLAQVRAEAYNARIVALLGAIERQVAALADPGRRTHAEADFLDRYRRQVHQRHGFLTPPDFDRRRRVPVADIYVPTGISEEDDVQRMLYSQDPALDSLTVWDMADRLDRTVLLGDPGGGKTTAANVLTDHFAGDSSPRIAFLVTLREYAAKTPIEWSVTEHIEQNLRTLYQSPAPDGLVERLLLTGRAVVIFDGLDELLDTSRRRDVSDRVEQFCSAYPLTAVLVISRRVGYDQARLDDALFSCYRLGGFGDEEVAEYAGKWFGTQEGLAPAEATAKAEAFLAESANAKDLRANPLLLSLMCILYRGVGSLPGDRAGVYARCAELLLRKWDEQRDLYRKLGSDHLVEPTLRYLAWWLFTRENSQTAATERELVAKAAEFLYERGYESEEQARAAARDFVVFCRGRMWVFSDAGTTADGEKLYGFTHRTFLEYFAAWQLAVRSESPEDLARTLASHIASNREWGTVGELAIKVKSEASDRGADRVYVVLLGYPVFNRRAERMLQLLVTCLPAARPSPATVRHLTRAVVDHALSAGPERPLRLGPLASLLGHGGDDRSLIAEEVSSRIASLVSSDEAQDLAAGLRLVVSIPVAGAETDAFWQGWAHEQDRLYAAEIAAAAVESSELRVLALCADVLTPRDAIAMPGGLSALATAAPIFPQTWRGTRHSPVLVSSYVSALARALLAATVDAWVINGITAIGQWVIGHPELPWVLSPTPLIRGLENMIRDYLVQPRELPVLGQDGNLGTAVVLCIAVEADEPAPIRVPPDQSGPAEPAATSMRPLARYVSRRLGGETAELPDLPVPAEFGQLFRDWAAHRVDFVEVNAEDRLRSRETRTRSE
jgi:hypothetical protein